MDADFISKMRQVLLKTKAGILKSLMQENEDFKAAVEDMGVKDLGDLASTDIDCHTLEVLGHQDKLRLNQVESALVRLENNKYGICAKCNKKISIARLEAIPYAVFCIECKAASESKRH
ncbi:MAG: TraR/DksA family transcriptional regulator [Spirochaetaceae bacterium]|jgi:DnaK suppressor protein|nr:TraR/DksA family transcriptional regulator [Spirochaetaceae bacterium]